MIILPELPLQLVLHVLKFLPANAQAYSGKLVNKAAYSILDVRTISAASQDVPVWVLQQYLPTLSTDEGQNNLLTKLLDSRAAAGDLQGVMFLRQHGARWSCRTTAAAAGAGQLGILLYLRAQNPPCEWDITTCNAAAAAGHLDILQWCRSQHPPTPWDESTCTAAASAGKLAVLQWLLKPYTPFRDITNCVGPNFSNSISENKQPQTSNPKICSKLQSGSQEFAGTCGLRVCGRPAPCPWPVWLRCSVAARAGQLHVLVWLRANGAPWDAGVCAAAAAGGHLHVLRWLRSQSPPCPLDSEACFEAASSGHLHILQYLRSQSPPADWDETTCLAAAMGGHFEVIRWLREQEPPCPWVAGTAAAASASGNREMVRWLKAAGSP